MIIKIIIVTIILMIIIMIKSTKNNWLSSFQAFGLLNKILFIPQGKSKDINYVPIT